MIVKLEPRFEDTDDEDEEDRDYVQHVKQEVEDPDSDYYEHLDDDDDEYYEPSLMPKKRGRGRPKRSGSPSLYPTRKRIKKEKRFKEGRKSWKVSN